MTAPTMDERRAVALRMREYKCPVLPSQQTTMEAVDAAVECMGLEDDDKMCTVRYFLDRLAELIDPGADTTMSAYGLLPEDGRAALDWVREHGGLGQVKMDYTMGECFTDLVDRIAAKLGVKVEGLDAQDSEPSIMDTIDRRMMPEGMEWPRFEDGEPVRFGDRFENADGGESVLHTLIAKDCRESLGDGVFWKLSKGAKAVWLKDGERVKRPAPKVLDADGVEIRAGDRLYDIDTGCGRTVRAVNDNGTVEFDGHGNRGWFGKFLTHRAPVLAADGKPLRVGDTVWYANGDSPQLKVIRIESDRVVTENARDGEQWWAAYILTHERPDSWERLEEDAGKNPFDYCKDVGHRLDTCEDSEEYKARDLVRRAKALAERGA